MCTKRTNLAAGDDAGEDVILSETLALYKSFTYLLTYLRHMYLRPFKVQLHVGRINAYVCLCINETLLSKLKFLRTSSTL